MAIIAQKYFFKETVKTIDEYISVFPIEVQERLQQICTTIRQAVPDATEKIAYKMPAFYLNGKPLVYFAGFKKHIGFYPIPNGIEAFQQELSAYKQGKGSVQFPLDKPVPYDLIRKIVDFRAKEKIPAADVRQKVVGIL